MPSTPQRGPASRASRRSCARTWVRHNSLDEVIGALARAGRDPREGFVVVTSRPSYELVQKAAVAGVRLLAAVPLPGGLAVRLAEASGITLVALLRGGTANVYAQGERLRR